MITEDLVLPFMLFC